MVELAIKKQSLTHSLKLPFIKMCSTDGKFDQKGQIIEMFYILKYLQIVLFNIKTIYIVLQI
jgi:hypothetical protein